MTLTLYNTLTRRKEPFRRSIRPTCACTCAGRRSTTTPTSATRGPVIVFDVLFRLLRHIYGAEHVTYARNITDVDDKINARAAEERRLPSAS